MVGRSNVSSPLSRQDRILLVTGTLGEGFTVYYLWIIFFDFPHGNPGILIQRRSMIENFKAPDTATLAQIPTS